MASPDRARPSAATGDPWARALRASLLAIALVVLAGCGVVAVTGPPEGDFGSRSSRQSNR